MEIVYKNPLDLKGYERNNKKHPKDQIKKIANSIKEFGFQQPVVIDNNNKIVIGHGRVEASLFLKLEKIPCVVASVLSDEQIRALRITDNKLSSLSKWDKEALGFELKELDNLSFDITITGFDLGFLENEAKLVPEIEFTKELLESHNYIVLYFDNIVDWEYAKTIFDLKTVKNLKGILQGIGRVLNGVDAINRLRGEDV